MQILARFRRNLADRSALDRAFEIDYRKIFHLQGALGLHLHEVSRLVPQTLHRRVHFFFRDLQRWQLHGNVFVIWQIKFRRSDHRCAEPHRFVIANLDVLQICQRHHTQLFFGDRIAITF